MKLNRKLLKIAAPATALALIAAGGAAVALAQTGGTPSSTATAQAATPSPTTTPGNGPLHPRHGPGIGEAIRGEVRAAAQALGITPQELLQDLKGGQSIADIAKAKNVDLSTVEAAMLQPVQQRLDQALKNGKITQQQHDTVLQKAQDGIAKLVQRTGLGKGERHGRFAQAARAELGAAAQALGITPQELLQDLKGGQSIADIAKAKNVDLSTVEAAMLQPIQQRLDQALKDGKIDQAKHDTLLQQATDRIAKLVQRSRAAQPAAPTATPTPNA